MDDIGIVQMLVDAHRAAMGRYDDSPEGEVPDDVIAQIMRITVRIYSDSPRRSIQAGNRHLTALLRPGGSFRQQWRGRSPRSALAVPSGARNCDW